MTQSMPWDFQKTPLILQTRKNETHDTVSFFFSTEEGHYFHFKAGQFVTLKVQINGQIHARSYSVSSLPNECILQLTIKRVPDGIVSNWLIDHLISGMALWTYGFSGQFNIIDHPPRENILLISAGCGVTPVMAMAKYLLQADHASHIQSIKFLHCARDNENIIFQDDIEALSKNYPHFEPHFIIEHALSSYVLKINEIDGMLDFNKLQQICSDLNRYTIYLCGPTGFMQLVRSLLKQIDFDMDYFHQESFSPTQNTQTQDSSHTISLSVPDFWVFKKDIAANAILLDILEQNNVPIVGACRSGVCGSCKCVVRKGKVESSSTETLTEQQIKEGYVLACSSKVLTDIEVGL